MALVIDQTNCMVGNRAMASVLLLYYHLLREGGFTNDQCVFLDPSSFDGFSYLDVKVRDTDMALEIDEELLREGAFVYLLSELNDQLSRSAKVLSHLVCHW